MGTRHLQTVIDRNGVKRISQYGQWDGYPSGQGLDILRFLKSADLNKYSENVEKINEITEEQIKMVNSNEHWEKQYPYLSRNCGSDIHKLIQEGEVEFVVFMDYQEAKRWCEGFYEIDLNKMTFTSDYYGVQQTYSLTDLPTDEVYLIQMGDAE